MGISATPIRSLLFVPGNREDRMRKAAVYGADAVVFDLEGSVPEASLPGARQAVRGVVDGRAAARPRLFVRVGSVASGALADDLRAVVHVNLDGVLLPQVHAVSDVVRADEMLTEAEQRAGVQQGRTILVPLVETAEAARTAYEIARCSAPMCAMRAEQRAIS